MEAKTAAYYHSPILYVGQAPEQDADGNVDVQRLGDEVYRAILTVGIAVRVLREGRFIFDFSNWRQETAKSEPEKSNFANIASTTLKRVSILNAHLACLYTALFRQQKTFPHLMVVEPSQVISMRSLDDATGSSNDVLVGWLSTAQFPKTYSEHRPVWNDPRVAGRMIIINTSTIDKSFHLLNAILENSNSDAILLADLFMRASKSLEDHNYSLSLITSWTITEKVLQSRWEKYLDSQREREIDNVKTTFINKERKKTLIGRDYSASVVSEILSLAGILPFELYKDMQVIRKVRNNWIHSLAPVSMEMASLSLKVTATILYLFERIYLTFPIAPSFHYIGKS